LLSAKYYSVGTTPIFNRQIVEKGKIDSTEQKAGLMTADTPPKGFYYLFIKSSLSL
jgi:hypothetical protein